MRELKACLIKEKALIRAYKDSLAVLSRLANEEYEAIVDESFSKPSPGIESCCKEILEIYTALITIEDIRAIARTEKDTIPERK